MDMNGLGVQFLQTSKPVLRFDVLALCGLAKRRRWRERRSRASVEGRRGRWQRWTRATVSNKYACKNFLDSGVTWIIVIRAGYRKYDPGGEQERPEHGGYFFHG